MSTRSAASRIGTISRRVRPKHALHLDGERIGVVVASGEILDGEQPPGTVGSDSLVRLLREALHEDDIKAVVLRIDSPGGSMFASEVIRREIDALRKAGKPVIASMSSVAASGGYYIAMDADEIWASPATLTGSIGVFAVFPTVERTLGKFGVTIDGVGTTPLADSLRLDRTLHDQAKEILQSSVEHAYSVFVGNVATARKKSFDDIDAVAQGRVWAGADAAQHGLVDHLGSYKDALNAAAKLAKLGKDYKVAVHRAAARLARGDCTAIAGAGGALRTRGGAGTHAAQWGTALVRAAGRRARAAVALHRSEAGVLLLSLRGELSAVSRCWPEAITPVCGGAARRARGFRRRATRCASSAPNLVVRLSGSWAPAFCSVRISRSRSSVIR